MIFSIYDISEFFYDFYRIKVEAKGMLRVCQGESSNFRIS